MTGEKWVLAVQPWKILSPLWAWSFHFSNWSNNRCQAWLVMMIKREKYGTTFRKLWGVIWAYVPCWIYRCKKVKWSEVTQSCPTLHDPMDCSLPGFSVHGIFQAIVLEWIAISFSRRSSRPRDQTRVSCIVDRHFTVWVITIMLLVMQS